jgi:DNA polymerase III subunit alpha
MDFAHLHCYTYATPVDGWLTPLGLRFFAEGADVQAMAIADRGTLWKAPEFAEEMTELGIKPIFGCEIQVVVSRKAEAPHPLVLLVEDEHGYPWSLLDVRLPDCRTFTFRS